MLDYALNLYYGHHFIYFDISIPEQKLPMHLRSQIMRRNNLNCIFIFSHILLFFLFIHNFAATSTTRELLTERLQDDAPHDPCEKVDCGEGKCIASSGSLLGFECLCRPGWSKMRLGPVEFPACTVPNCTIHPQCGNAAPPPPPPPPANPSPNYDLFNPCNIVWCGDGTCVANGLGYSCKCNEGSANLFNLTGVACFKECYIGADCKGVTIGPPLSSPLPPGNAFGPPPSSTTPPKNASGSVPKCSTSLGPVTMILLCLIFLTSI